MNFYAATSLSQMAPQSCTDQISVEKFYDDAANVAAALKQPCTYLNNGYWDEGISTRQQAGDNLMRVISHGIVKRHFETDNCLSVLDVACGLGATTNYLSKRWPSADIVGINVTDRQLDLCRINAPTCRFARMDATSLAVPSTSVDIVVCIEAAFQFRTRQAFLEEAYRVLKPTGIIALTDVLVARETHEVPHKFSAHHPVENQLDSTQAYRDLMEKVGFRNVAISDITNEGALSYFRHHTSELLGRWRQGTLTFAGLQGNLRDLLLLECLLHIQVLVFGSK